ncbi:MAG: rRNA maturation RNase YbeY [Gammaproteobacteria bacterium]|jgi:rRNA maturation RNase YbeY
MNLSDQQRVYVQTQIEIDHVLPLSAEDIQECIDLSFAAAKSELKFPFAVNVRIVGHDESMILNNKYKKKKLPTNVLAFKGNLDEERNMGIQPPYLGDVVICFPVVEKEAMEQEKSFSFHFAHMVVHGFLHLLGFDHQNDRDEKNMQEIENQVLEKISILQWVQ